MITPKSADRAVIFLDNTGAVFDFVLKGLGAKKEEFCGCVTLGVKIEDKVIAGIIYSSLREGRDVWLTIFSNDKRWCNKRILNAIFKVAFDFFKCRRVSVRVDACNTKSRRLVEGLGFQKEGVLRAFEDNGHNALIYSMLKDECLYLKKNNINGGKF